MVKNRFAIYFTGIFFTVLVVFTQGCKPVDVFEKNVSIPQHAWGYGFKPAYQFAVTDTAAQYQLYVVLRHTDAYRYNNVWLQVGTRFPGDSSMQYRRLDLQLGTDANGWEGTGMNDIFEVRKLISNGPVKFPRAGTYEISLAQVMRENPLQHIMSAGVRIEKIKSL
jgi:gliding motility-associated lipoprotein GldH